MKLPLQHIIAALVHSTVINPAEVLDGMTLNEAQREATANTRSHTYQSTSRLPNAVGRDSAWLLAWQLAESPISTGHAA